MNVLILGGGYIGKNLYSYLNRLHDVTLVTQKEVDYTFAKKYVAAKGFKEYLWNVPQVDVVVNCSGYTGVPNVDACESNKEECWYYNVIAPQKTAELCNLFKVPVVHISSGCIYAGDENYTEDDVPNLGLYSDNSSFYSKSKHAGELVLKDTNTYILRIRMPFCHNDVNKNILVKLLKYDRVINEMNSLTSIPDLCKLVETICVKRSTIDPGIYNAINGGKIKTTVLRNIMSKYGLTNPNWEEVTETSLKLACRRSNCTLSNYKLLKNKIEMPNLTDSLVASIKLLAKEKHKNECQDIEKV